MFHSLGAKRRILSLSVPMLVASIVTALFCRAQTATAPAENLRPVNYQKDRPTDPIARLQQKIDTGELKLAFDKKHGYLSAVLKALDIPESSQTLVFSRTSFQRDAIAPWRPRALYFNNDAYVGWVQEGSVLEVASVDKDLGTVFYTLDQGQSNMPKFNRQSTDCLQCHQGLMTDSIPGLVIRSTLTEASGTPILNQPNYLTSSASPFSERWGGWYVTGKVGTSHMGNFVVHAGESPSVAASAATDQFDVTGKFEQDQYLAPGSDVVSLLVLTHQAELHNRLTKVAYLVRGTEETRTGRSSSALTRPATPAAAEKDLPEICEPLVRALLFCDEVPLPEAVKGSSDFAERFVAAGPKDGKGRSLRELDLKTRVFKYPCSYLIYSDSFAALPAAAKEIIFRRLWEVLSGRDSSKDFEHLTAEDRKATLEILRDTMQGLPVYWKTP